jgi:hypothetical protein
MNPQYAALRALGIPAGHHDATRFVYFWAPPKVRFWRVSEAIPPAVTACYANRLPLVEAVISSIK